MAERRFSSVLWKHDGAAGWFFASLPPALSTELRAEFGALSPGWGMLPVRVRLGKSAWKTSLFFDTQRGTYLMPVKADVRRREALAEGDALELSIELA